MCRLQFGTAATQSLGLPQAAERRCRGLGAFFWLLGSAGSGNTYNLWDHQNRADPGLGLVVADTANVPSRPQNRVVAAFLEKDLFFNGLLTLQFVGELLAEFGGFFDGSFGSGAA